MRSKSYAVISNHELLEGEVPLRLLMLYARTFGSLDGLSLEDGPVPNDLLLGAYRRLPKQILADICKDAVNQLTAREMGLPPGQSLVKHVDWAVVMYCATGAGTLREAIQRCANCFEAIDWRCGRITLEVHGDVAAIRMDTGPRKKLRLSTLLTLFGVAEIHNLFQTLILARLPIIEIHLENTSDSWAKLNLPPMSFPVITDSTWIGFTFPASHLDHSVICSFDELSSRVNVNVLFRDIEPSEPKAPVCSRVKHLTLRTLTERQKMPSFYEIAEALGSSSLITLRRALKSEGITYRAIKDSCRREMGLTLLRQTKLSIEEIAARLDYCDANAFREAFKEWIGTTPSQYRGSEAAPDSVLQP